MGLFNKDIGRLGEDIAEDYLKDYGYEIIEKNFMCKIGELDIIARDNSHIVFIEVKTRNGTHFGMPSEAVTASKQFKIYKTAQFYIMRKKLYKLNFRFDVVEVILNATNNKHYVRVIKNAFQI
jgi:putative endonuclease